jgi:CHAT domain-containing protein/tetratricopeptide (TPR) repeat protein
LIRSLEKHLDGDELDGLVSTSRHAASEETGKSRQEIEESSRHVEICPDCAQKVHMHKSAQREIESLRIQSQAHPRSECARESEWVEVAAGIRSDGETRRLLVHAARCRHCGPLLAKATAALSTEVSAEEEASLSNLKGARPKWQRTMGKTLEELVRSEQKGAKRDGGRTWFSVSPRLAVTAATMLVLLAACWILYRISRPADVDHLLAEAYTERRTMEVRISGAKYAPLRIERGGTNSNIDKPEALLKAEALIGDKLRSNPADPSWLDYKARADLLDGNYDAAILTLLRALEIRPDSVILLTDQASAYCLRAESANRPIDYGKAIDALGRALARVPDNPIALFNRAIIEDKLYLFTPAITDWQHYLRLDPSGPWADEARTRLHASEEKVRLKHSSLEKPLMSPARLERESGQEESEELNSRIEEYQQEALETWLPTYAHEPTGSRSKALVEAALLAMSGTLIRQHGDRWLSDVLYGRRGRNFESAADSLAEAIKANTRGDYAGALVAAKSASRLFHASGNIAAELRADAEQVYALHLLYDGLSCTNLAEKITSRVKSAKFEWLSAQINLEKSNCFALLGDFGKSRKALEDGIELAKEHGFLESYSRGVGFQADTLASFGNTQAGFLLASQGLYVFWSSRVDLMKGYNLYTDLDTASDVLRLPYLQIAVWNQATSLIDRHPDLVQRAMAHRWYASAAYLANMPDLAREEFSKASSLFSSAPRSVATIRGRVDADTWLAGLAIRRGDVERASALLVDIAENLKNAPGFEQEIGFYTSEAQLQLLKGNSPACETALRSAIFLAEKARESLSSENARIQWIKQTADAYRTLVAWKLGQGDASAALEYWEWYKSSGVRPLFTHRPRISQEYGGEPLTSLRRAPDLAVPSMVAEELPALQNTTVVSYAVFQKGVASWAYNNRGISSKWIVKPAIDLQKSTERLLRLCADRDSDIDSMRSSARELYDLLIAPFESQIGNDGTLIVEPDGPLSGLPFEVLIDHEGHYLLEKSNVVISPGLFHLAWTRKMSAIGPATRALIVSVPAVAETGFVVTTDAESEAQAVGQQFISAHQLNGSAASLTEIRRAIVGTGVFHFAGHAVASPERNGLLLNEQDPRTRESRLLNAQNLDLSFLHDLQLAVLSACATGTDLEPGASGTETLAEALLRSGVPDVIVSRWNVDSEATRNLMERFYKHLVTGQNAARSLRAAQLELSGQYGLARPYYWAAFGVRGI